MTVVREIEPEDFRAFVRYVNQTLQTTGRAVWLPFGILGLLIVATILLFAVVEIPFDTNTSIACGGILTLWIIIVGKMQNRRFGPTGLVLGRKEITVADEGIMDRSAGAEVLYRWPTVQQVGVTAEHYFIMLDRMLGIIVPRRCFANDADDQRFYRELQRRRPQAFEADYDDGPVQRAS